MMDHMNSISISTDTIKCILEPQSSFCFEKDIPSYHPMSNRKKFFSKDYKPSDRDVIIGKGAMSYNHIGNEIFRRTIALRYIEYTSAKGKIEKSEIIFSILGQIQKIGGTFVKYDTSSGLWYQVDDVLARDKVSQAFRNKTYQKNKNSRRRYNVTKTQNANEHYNRKRHSKNSIAASLIEKLQPQSLEKYTDWDNSKEFSNFEKQVPAMIDLTLICEVDDTPATSLRTNILYEKLDKQIHSSYSFKMYSDRQGDSFYDDDVESIGTILLDDL